MIMTVDIDLGEISIEDLLDSLRHRLDRTRATESEQRMFRDFCINLPGEALETALEAYHVPQGLIDQVRPYLQAKLLTTDDLMVWKGQFAGAIP